MYVCGITPYDSAHLGHIFTFLTYDLLQRRLENMGRKVVMVRNITDVDEPIYKKAHELGIPYTQLADEETASFQDVMRRLGFREPTHEPRASRYIEAMAAAVSRLLDNGHAYFVDRDVYFDIGTLDSFSELAHFDERLKLGLFKKRGGDPTREGKRQPMDFLLWRAVDDPADQAAWEVGRDLPTGRPGWHIECTVMSSELLGLPFDLHGGGNDLIFPHHECEIAQSKALVSTGPADRWAHTAPILYGGEKMSKSLGNLIFAKDLLDQYSADAIRLALMHYHYREGGEWIPELLDEAARLLGKLQQAALHADIQTATDLLEHMRNGLDDDLNTHAMLHCLEDFADAPHGDGSGQPIVRQAFDLLGLTFPEA